MVFFHQNAQVEFPLPVRSRICESVLCKPALPTINSSVFIAISIRDKMHISCALSLKSIELKTVKINFLIRFNNNWYKKIPYMQ